jgi:hypothetical protein
MIGLFVAFGGLCFGYDTGYEETMKETAHTGLMLIQLIVTLVGL